MNVLRNAPPDLLRRFVPTPFKWIAASTVLETNDLELLEAIDGRAILSLAPDFTFRIVRDTCGDTGSEQRIFDSGCLRLVTIGFRTLFLVDRSQRRSYAFLARDFPAARVSEALRLALHVEQPRLEQVACSM